MADGALAMWRVLFLSSGTSAGRRGGCGGSPPSRRLFPAVVLLVLTVAVPGRTARAGEPARGHVNFVVHGIVAERAAVIRGHAETVRARAFETLLGDSSPRPWLPRYDVHIHATPHATNFRVARHRGQAWTAADLLAVEDYPPGPGRQRVFYGQSAALVRWMIARRDTRVLVRFLEQCPELGLEAALERHYDLDSVAGLELAWKEVPPMQTIGLAGRSP